MNSQYLDFFDPTHPPHIAGSTGGRIIDIRQEADWLPLQKALADWHNAHAVNGLVPFDTPADCLARYFGNINKLQVVDNGADFQYRIYGVNISKTANLDMKGKRVSDLVEPTRTILLAQYRDLCREPRLFVGELSYEGEVTSHPRWARAVSPLGDRENRVWGFMVATCPMPERLSFSYR